MENPSGTSHVLCNRCVPTTSSRQDLFFSLHISIITFRRFDSHNHFFALLQVCARMRNGFFSKIRLRLGRGERRDVEAGQSVDDTFSAASPPKPPPPPTFDSYQGKVLSMTIPEYAHPGEDFQTYLGDRIVRIRCPLDAIPGETIIQFGCSESHRYYNPDIEQIGEVTEYKNLSPSTRASTHDKRTYYLNFPPDVQAGQSCTVFIPQERRSVSLTCPKNYLPGDKVSLTIVPSKHQTRDTTLRVV
jgi:hypothetical protein